MRTLIEIIGLEISGKHDEAYDTALKSPYQTFELYLEYRDFNDDLNEILNNNFIL